MVRYSSCGMAVDCLADSLLDLPVVLGRPSPCVHWWRCVVEPVDWSPYQGTLLTGLVQVLLLTESRGAQVACTRARQAAVSNLQSATAVECTRAERRRALDVEYRTTETDGAGIGV